MPITLRRGDERGRTRLGWLDSQHTFSFGGYQDVQHMGFGPLRVLNDDRVAGGAGFPEHPHRDMEILSWVIQGGLAHRDSTGAESVLEPGTAQVMSAGTGVHHSEYNASQVEPVHFLQIWIIPDAAGHSPAYAEQRIAPEQRAGAFAALASGGSRREALGEHAGLPIHQDAAVHVIDLTPSNSARFELDPNRAVWLHLATGQATTHGHDLMAGDAIALVDEPFIELSGEGQALLFDLPKGVAE